MKPVQSELKKWMQQNKNFKENYQRVREEVLNNPEIQTFLSQNSQLTQQAVDKHLIKLHEYKTQSKQCDKCASFGQCVNMLQGYSPVLQAENGDINLVYEKCHNRIDMEKQWEQQRLIQSLYMPKEILNATISDIDHDAERGEGIRQLLLFLNKISDELPAKGIYFHGAFGVGKTYMMGALANALKEYNLSSMLIYMPELVREMKSSIKDDSINEKISYFKEADVLMLDDIGAETQSPWFRDEILGSILQYRMMENKPVFFTSNYSLSQLEQQMETTNRGGNETVKAGRIIERIKQVSMDVKLAGKNRRDQ
ncbi:primosomal protein DnaI [Lentibacillus halophilus]|uniref:Primosomal protein DnaI n=1 Tax=Lentibacillus halophilus TaxID=295065 RepID=A0ABP3IW07_9BACI